MENSEDQNVDTTGFWKTLNWGETRAALDYIAEVGGEHVGIPMPIHGTPMTVHPSYPYAKIFERKSSPVDPAEPLIDIVNAFYSRRTGRDYVIFREKGKLCHQMLPIPSAIQMQLQTLGVVNAWSVAAEAKALEKLATLVNHYKFRCYMMTGSFLETSPRSRVTYLFRKLRPTVAMSTRNDLDVTVLCALCLHPIGYYDGTWGGALTPTDDVIAHLMLMRGDEHDFWKQSNQHPTWHPGAGL